MEEDLSKEISIELESRFRKHLRGSLTRNNKFRSKNVHVTDLTSPCSRQAWYYRKLEEPEKDDALVGILYTGTMFHQSIPLSKRNEVPFIADIRNMKALNNLNEITEINTYDCVSGTADEIIDYKNEICIVDKKTYSSKRGWNPKEPDPSYVWQLNIYKLLLFITEGVEAKYGAIFYMDVATRLENPLIYVMELKPLDEIREYVTKKLDELKMLVPPQKTVTWKCKYCPWAPSKNGPCDVTNAEILEATRKK